MAAHAEAHALPAGHGRLGHSDRVMVGLITALLSEIMLFGAFFTAFFYIRYKNYPYFPPSPYELPVNSTGINTAVLISSSFSMHWALVSAKRNNRRGMTWGLVITLVLGLLFLALQLREYHSIGFTPETGAFASTFFCLTGLHGLHVLAGAVLLAVALTRTLRGHYSPEHHMGLELTGIYWHFVDLVWVVLYTVVYMFASGARVPGFGG